jgi:xanthine dehydrogenase accessory factor
MLVTAAGVAGSLGDTGLEVEAVARARAMLHEGGRKPCLTRSEGGATLIHEPVRDDRFDLMLFGAGHVGRAVVEVMAGLACRITWIDSRAGELPADVPGNVAVRVSSAPEGEVAGLPDDACWLVMTHSHDLDFELCARVLERGGFRYLGLIGSATKRARFRNRFLARGIAPEALARLTCPIGIAGIAGKHPREIAIAVAAEILRIDGTAR